MIAIVVSTVALATMSGWTDVVRLLLSLGLAGFGSASTFVLLSAYASSDNGGTPSNCSEVALVAAND